jgi:MFS family permease
MQEPCEPLADVTEAPARLLTRAFVALGAATLAFFVAAGIVLPVAPQFAADGLGADETGVGVAIASFSIAALLLRPLVGWSSDRFGRRPLLIGGALLTVAALALHLVAEDLAMFIVARALLGAGEGFFLVAAIAAGSDIAPPNRRGEAISFLSLSVYLGIAIGPPIGEALISAGYDAVWLAALVVTIGAVLLAAVTPESAPAVLANSGPRARAPLIHPAGLFPGFIILLGLWGMAGYFTFVPLHARALGMDGAGAPFVLFALVVVVLRIVGARWPDRYGAARVSGVALFISTVGLAVTGLAPTAEGLLVGTFIFAAGVAFTMPALVALAVSRVPSTERGAVVGTSTVFMDVAFGIAPVVLGVMANRMGYEPTFVFSAVLAAMGGTLLFARRRSLQLEPAPA